MKRSEHNLKVPLTSHKQLWHWGHISHGKRWDLNTHPIRPFCGVAQCAWWAAPSPPPCWWCPCGSPWCWSQSSEAATIACAALWTAPSGPRTARRNTCVQVNFSYTFCFCHPAWRIIQVNFSSTFCLSHILRNRTGHAGVQQTSTTICSRTSASRTSLMHWKHVCRSTIISHLPFYLIISATTSTFVCHTLGTTTHAGLPSSCSYSFTLNQFIINVQFCLCLTFCEHDAQRQPPANIKPAYILQTVHWHYIYIYV